MAASNRIASLIFAALALSLSAASAAAQSGCPSIVTGAVLTAGQWNACFQGKADYLGFVPLNPSNLVAVAPIAVTPTAGVVQIGLNVNASLVVDGGGNLGINLSHPNLFLATQTVDLGSGTGEPAAGAGAGFNLYGADVVVARLEATAFGASSIFDGRASNGTRSSPTAVTSGFLLASFEGKGYDTSVWTGTGGSLHLYAEGTWTPTSHPGEACLATTASSATTTTDALCVHNNGGVTINQNATQVVSVPSGGMQIYLPNGSAQGYQVNGWGQDGLVTFVTAGGTNASPSAVTTGMELGAVLFKGWNGSANSTAKVIYNGSAAENWNAGAEGTYASIYTTVKGTTTVNEVVRIQASGGVSIGTANAATDGGNGVLVASGVVIPSGSVTASQIFGGSAAGSTLSLISTSNGSPSGDDISLQASVIVLRNPGTLTSVVDVGLTGTTAGQLVIASPTANAMTIQNAASASGTATIPSGTYNVVGDSPTQTLTNKTIASSTDVLGGVTMTLGSDGTGDIYYRNSGGVLTRLAAGAGGTGLEIVGGIPSWQALPGTGTVTSAVIAASGGATTSGTCTITTTGTCTVAAPGGFLNVLRNNSLTSWFHGGVGSAITVTTSGGWCAEGVWVVPTGASVTCQQGTGGNNAAPYYNVTITGAASVTDVKVRFVVESLQAALLTAQNATFQMQWVNGTGGTVTPTLATKYPTAQDNWTSSTADLAATNLQACSSAAICTPAYTLLVSNSATTGYEFVVDLGNNFSTNGKTAKLIYFDARATPGVSTGLNAAPPPFEMRDPTTDVAWNQRFYQTDYDNGVAPGTATRVGMSGTIGAQSSNAGAVGNVFKTAMRCDASMSVWDGNGNSGKASTLTLPSTWTDNFVTVTTIVPGQNGFVAAAPSSENAVFHYAADCTANMTGG